ANPSLVGSPRLRATGALFASPRRGTSPFHFLFSYPRPPRPLHSFPTRRSSDLQSCEDQRQRRTAPDPPAKEHRSQPRQRHHRQRSEEHTSELQSPDHLVCRLLLEKKKQHTAHRTHEPGYAVRTAFDRHGLVRLL